MTDEYRVGDRFTLAELRAIGDRVRAEVRAKPAPDRCRHGHENPERYADGDCKPCKQARQRGRRP